MQIISTIDQLNLIIRSLDYISLFGILEIRELTTRSDNLFK